MNKQQLDFINNLNYEDIVTLKSLFDEDNMLVKQYLDKIIDSSNVIDINTLLAEIPVNYIPIIGVCYPFHLNVVSDVLKCSDKDMKKTSILGPIKINNIKYAANFLVTHVQEKISMYRENNLVITSGIKLLDDNLELKKPIIEDQFDGIVEYLIQNGDKYIFSGTTRIPDLEHLSPNVKLKLVEILARYSYYEDLANNNIESFQKFIKK